MTAAREIAFLQGSMQLKILVSWYLRVHLVVNPSKSQRIGRQAVLVAAVCNP